MIETQWNPADVAKATGQTAASTAGGADACTEARTEAERDWSAIWQREMKRGMNGGAHRDAGHSQARRDDEGDADCFQGLLPGYLMPLPLAPSLPDGMGSIAPGSPHVHAVAGARAAQDDGDSGRAMRLHAEWSATGVRLWVGASLDDQAGMVLLGRPLRAGLERQGVRLLSLVCNGRIVYADATATHGVEDDADPSRADVLSAEYPPDRSA